MPAQPERINHALARHLAEAGLTPRALARELNRSFGLGTLAETAPYHWRDAGRVPRSPLPALTASVISRRVGRIVAASDLWPGHNDATDGTLIVEATAGMNGPWTPVSTMRIAEDWLMGGLVDRRLFLTASGAALARAIAIYLDARFDIGSAGLPPMSADDPLIDQIEATVPRLQLLDDEQGGARGLDYVGAQMRAVLLVLHDGGHTDGARLRLLRALADLAQLAGWKAIDAAQSGLAQRYLLTGLRAAHESGYRAMEAHILADLSFQSASLGDTRGGVAIGEAAQRAADRSSAAVQASVGSRLAYAYAAAGRPHDCEDAWLDSHERLSQRGLERDPEWMYYLTPNHLDCQAGYAMILAGRNAIAADQASGGRALLRKGAALLRTGVYAHRPDAQFQRRALYEGAWLSLAYTAHGKLDDACAVAELALPRMRQVRSPRSTALMTTLAGELRRRRRNHTVDDFVPRLEAALSQNARQPRPAL